MTHELKKIIEAFIHAEKNKLKAVLATVVDLDGSSYRRPGVRMLIQENGKMIGAVSGGCVEKEVLRQSQEVFKTGHSKLMTYDGRYRLGCEGILYILIEPFQPETALIEAFHKCIEERRSFEVISRYKKKEGIEPGLGSEIRFSEKESFPFSGTTVTPEAEGSLSVFSQEMPPCFKLVIVGAEHDAVQLCLFASFSGWEVSVISSPSDPKTLANFPGATKIYSVAAEEMDVSLIDGQTAVVLMTHNFANDLKYLLRFKDTDPAYIGLLGPAHRREKLLNQFLEYCPEISDQFLDRIHGPAGINIGAETPQEIAVSIIAEILSVVREQEPMPLHKKMGGIHS
ncbi:XshC-Cox1-family protein [Leptobacterium flavescens]|uniref:XshC-Cox1-family protein n=1 Tax=Leptobacterium flavescens TaxID=472055 RepID=A0A6P0UHC0_9FLAO|nr:XdhC/CoxI family protein [Leptobacterium flavescens]NER11860.1 XshC-Cox1-family protein [Leptobacterium flavescens]